MARITSTEINPTSMPVAERRWLADSLYEVHRQIFDGVEPDAFAKYVIESKAEHTWLWLHQDEAKAIVGYCALHIFEKDFQGVKTAVFRAEAGTRRDYRGRNVNGRAVLFRILRYLLAHPRRPLYYLGSLVHPSSYIQFGKYFGEVWPRRGTPTPPALVAFMDELATSFGLERVDPEDPMVRKVGWRTRETEMEREYWAHCDRPAARFFIEANPGYGDGHGLVTLVPLTGRNVRQAIMHLFAGRLRRPTELARAMAMRLPIGAQLLKTAEVERLLRAAPLLASFDDEVLDAIIQGAELVALPAGRYLFKKGEPSDEVYLVMRGAVFVLADDGDEEKVLDELGKGAMFGEIAMLGGERRSASVRAATSSTLLRIPRRVLLPLLEEKTDLLNDVWKSFNARRFDDHVRGLERFGHLGRKARMAWFARGEQQVLASQAPLLVEAGGFLFVSSGVVTFDSPSASITARGPALLEAKAPLHVVGEEPARLIRLPPPGP